MLYSNLLKRNYQTILSYTAFISIITGLTLLFPLLALVFYPTEIIHIWSFLFPGIILIALGFLLWKKLSLVNPPTLSIPESSVIVILTWIVAILVSTIPFIFISKLNFHQAVFESTSGWTTTGLSVINVEETSPLILLFRSTIQLVGGAGFAIIALSALTAPSGSGLSLAEGRSEQLVPNVRRSAFLVLKIYTGYVAVGIVALKLAGMTWFDSVNHAFASLSTGGFSTHTQSIGYWDNPLIEGITIVLMLAGTLNFVSSYLLLTGKFKALFHNGEFRLLLFLIPISSLILIVAVTLPLYLHLGKSIRVAIFESVSALSTTGFSTVGYLNWVSLGWLILIVLMIIGGGTGSTAGGLKQYRIYILYRSAIWEIKRFLLPTNTITEPDLWQGEIRNFLSDRQISQVSIFVFIYLFIYLIGCGILTANGYTLPESLFEYASALSTVGLSVGVTNPNAPISVLWSESLGMFLGRLEFFPVFLGLIQLTKDLTRLLLPHQS
jgi:trk system potassium uptake protein